MRRFKKKDEIAYLKNRVEELEVENRKIKEHFDEYRMSEPENLRTFLFKHMRLLQTQPCRGGCVDSEGQLFIAEIRHVAELIKEIDEAEYKRTNCTDATDDEGGEC